MMRSCIAAALILLIATSNLVGQRAKAVPAFPTREFKHPDKLRTEVAVDDGKEKTFVFLEGPIVERSMSNRTSIRFIAMFEHIGKEPVKPEHISIAIYNFAPKCSFSLHPAVVFFVDDEQIKLSQSFKSHSQRKPDEQGVGFGWWEMRGDRCDEFTAMFLSQKTLLRIAKANRVEAKIGDLRFKFTEANLEALRDFASRMVL